MPPKMVVCDICLDTVSKRSTLSLATLGSSGGRACREHPEVAELLRLQEDARTERDLIARAEHTIQVLTGVSMVQVLYSFLGASPELVYQQLGRQGYTSDMIRDIRARVEEIGGPYMSEEEKLVVAVQATQLQERFQEPGMT